MSLPGCALSEVALHFLVGHSRPSSLFGVRRLTALSHLPV